MGNTPVFSVVIPTHNRETLILKTLQSVFAQTFPKFEIIVVDDCSTDGTDQVLDPLIVSGQIRFIKHDQNYERAQARNTGMANARGEFLTFLDSDDLMCPTNLEDAAHYIEANSETRLFQNRYQLIDDKGRVLCKYDLPSLASPLQAITGGNFLSSIGVFIHRDIYQNYRFDTNPVLTGSEDWDFWLRVVPYYKPGRIDKINSGIVQHGNRSTNHIELSELQQRLGYLIKKIKSDPELSFVYRKYLKRLEAGALLYTSTVANLMCDHREARRCLLRAAALDLRLAGSVNFIKALGIAMLRLDKGY